MLHLNCRDCGMIDLVSYKEAIGWKCPHCLLWPDKEKISMKILTLQAPRRMGKTTAALEMLREDQNCGLICNLGSRAMELSKQNPDLDSRIYSAYSPKKTITSRNLKKIIIDDADCINVSLLLEWINFCLEKDIELVVTTTE